VRLMARLAQSLEREQSDTLERIDMRSIHERWERP